MTKRDVFSEDTINKGSTNCVPVERAVEDCKRNLGLCYDLMFPTAHADLRRSRLSYLAQFKSHDLATSRGFPATKRDRRSFLNSKCQTVLCDLIKHHWTEKNYLFFLNKFFNENNLLFKNLLWIKINNVRKKTT